MQHHIHVSSSFELIMKYCYNITENFLQLDCVIIILIALDLILIVNEDWGYYGFTLAFC